MAKVGLFYGSNTGNTELVSFQMKDEFDRRQPGLVEVHNIGSSTPEQILGYEYLVFGIPTWNTGQLQDDWDAYLPRLKKMDFNGKKIAIFGLGDQNGYGYNFLDAVGTLGDAVMERGATVFGFFRIDSSFQFEESKAQVDDHFMGLGIDQEAQANATAGRISTWVTQVLREFAL